MFFSMKNFFRKIFGTKIAKKEKLKKNFQIFAEALPKIFRKK